MPGFIIWSIVGLLLMGIGISDFFIKKPAGFWANAEAEKVTDVKKYNKAVGTLIIVYAVIFILLGTPLLSENKVLILFTMLGVMFETIITMCVYTVGISEKYKVK